MQQALAVVYKERPPASPSPTLDSSASGGEATWNTRWSKKPLHPSSLCFITTRAIEGSSELQLRDDWESEESAQPSLFLLRKCFPQAQDYPDVRLAMLTSGEEEWGRGRSWGGMTQKIDELIDGILDERQCILIFCCLYLFLVHVLTFFEFNIGEGSRGRISLALIYPHRGQ